MPPRAGRRLLWRIADPAHAASLGEYRRVRAALRAHIAAELLGTPGV
jgi:hypothetical protein